MGNDLMDTMVGGAIGILAIHEVGEMVRGRRRKATVKRSTTHKAVKKSKQPKKSTPHSTKGLSKGGRVIHRGARGGRYVIRHGRKVYV